MARITENVILCCTFAFASYNAYIKREPEDLVLFYAVVLFGIYHLWNKLKFLVIIGGAGLVAFYWSTTDIIVLLCLGLGYVGYCSWYRLGLVNFWLLALVAAVYCRLNKLDVAGLAGTSLCIILWTCRSRIYNLVTRRKRVARETIDNGECTPLKDNIDKEPTKE